MHISRGSVLPRQSQASGYRGQTFPRLHLTSLARQSRSRCSLLKAPLAASGREHISILCSSPAARVRASTNQLLPAADESVFLYLHPLVSQTAAVTRLCSSASRWILDASLPSASGKSSSHAGKILRRRRSHACTRLVSRCSSAPSELHVFSMLKISSFQTKRD